MEKQGALDDGTGTQGAHLGISGQMGTCISFLVPGYSLCTESLRVAWLLPCASGAGARCSWEGLSVPRLPWAGWGVGYKAGGLECCT